MTFYERVPRTFRENIAYRVRMRERAVCDTGFRRALIQACRDDVLFFFSAFCWLYEPRPRKGANGRELPKMIPFIPWEHQIPAVQHMVASLGYNDIAVFKSRGEGFSWISVLLALHNWLFEDMAKVGLVSNTEKKSDDPGNLDSLLAKVDWELSRLPEWMAGEKGVHWDRNKAEHSLVNLRNGSQINAFAATSDAGRAGRYKWFLCDELAFWDAGKDRKFMESVRESTDCRLAISTPNGNSGAFYDMVHVPSSTDRIRVHWVDNPYKNRGLYRVVNNKAIAVDPVNNPLTDGYDGPSFKVFERWSRLRNKGFRLEGHHRSPWYDLQCDRADATPQSIAQELDLDFGGSMYRVFSSEFFDKARATERAPLLVGSLSYSPESLKAEWVGDKMGQFKLWCNIDAKGSPPKGQYAVSADVSAGLGGSHTSNSVIHVADITAMEQVGQFVSNTVEPSELAELLVVTSKWFHGAYLGWEINGPGHAVAKRVLEIGYPDVYTRNVLWRRGHKKERKVGWQTSKQSKEAMFSDFLRMVRNGEYVLRDKDLVDECGEYVRLGPNSDITHVQKSHTSDDSGRGESHGDRVIAACVAIQLLKDRGTPGTFGSEEQSESGPPPVDTMAWRLAQFEKAESAVEWDDRTTADLARGRRA